MASNIERFCMRGACFAIPRSEWAQTVRQLVRRLIDRVVDERTNRAVCGLVARESEAGVHQTHLDRMTEVSMGESIELRPVSESDLEMFRLFAVVPGLVGLDWAGFRDVRAPMSGD